MRLKRSNIILGAFFCLLFASSTSMAQDVAQRVSDFVFFSDMKEIEKAREKIREEVKDPSNVVIIMIDFTRENLLILTQQVKSKDFLDENPVVSYSFASVSYGINNAKRVQKIIDDKTMETIVVAANNLVKNARYGVFVNELDVKENYMLLSKAYRKGEFFGELRLAEIISPKKNTKSWVFIENFKELIKE